MATTPLPSAADLGGTTITRAEFRQAILDQRTHISEIRNDTALTGATTTDNLTINKLLKIPPATLTIDASTTTVPGVVDLSAIDGGYVKISNAAAPVTITQIKLGTGQVQFVQFVKPGTLQAYSGTNTSSPHLPGDADIAIAASDTAIFYGQSSTSTRCFFYTKADGTPIVGGGSTSVAATLKTLTDADYATILADADVYTNLLQPNANRNITISSVAYPTGSMITVAPSTVATTIKVGTGLTMKQLGGVAQVTSIEVAANEMAAALKVSATEWVISVATPPGVDKDSATAWTGRQTYRPTDLLTSGTAATPSLNDGNVFTLDLGNASGPVVLGFPTVGAFTGTPMTLIVSQGAIPRAVTFDPGYLFPGGNPVITNTANAIDKIEGMMMSPTKMVCTITHDHK